MKDQDLMRALGYLPQDMLDEFADWQENRTPLSDADEAADIQRVYDTESTKKRKISTAKTRPWTIGICAAMAACLVMAVSVGREAIGNHRDAMPVGYSAGESVETQALTELSHDNYDEVKMNGMNTATKHNRADAPYSLSAQIIRTPEQAQPVIDLLTPEDPADNSAEQLLALFDADALAEQDVIFFGIPEDQFAGDTSGATVSYRCVEITRDGKLTLDAVCMQHISPEPSDSAKEYITYYGIAVEKNVLPDLTDFALRLTTFRAENMPEDVKQEKDGWLEKYRAFQAEYGDEWDAFNALSQNQEGFRLWLEKEHAVPEDCEEVQEIREDAAQEPFPAWYWVNYRGTSIPVTIVPDKHAITVDLIRTAADGEKYLTGDPEQDQTPLRTQLSKEWLETGFDEAQVTDPVSGTVFSIDPEHPVQDMLFVGVPAAVMPSNVVRWDFHGGTITPSGKLHLDFSVQTVSDTAIKALNAEYDDDTNFYFFISIPDGSIPELTDYEVTFSTYYTSAEPDAYTAEAPDETGTDGMNRRNTWLSQQPESTSYWSSVLGAKYITPIPEEQPGTAAVTDSFSGAITPPLENQPIVSVLPCGDIDTITLVLPVHDIDAAAVLSDLHVSADGILSVTLNEYYEKNGVDLTQDTAWYQWMLGVPHGSLPEIKDMDIRRVNCDTEDAFLQIAGQLCTITTE